MPRIPYPGTKTLPSDLRELLNQLNLNSTFPRFAFYDEGVPQVHTTGRREEMARSDFFEGKHRLQVAV